MATEDGERFVAALLDQGAVALERAEFAADAADAEALRRTDRLRSALFNSISHDLRTPLSTVLGSATTLIDFGKSLAPKVRDDLLHSIREEAERLNRYVGDLLDMTRLEGGGLITRREWVDVRDVLRAAVERVKRRLEGREIDAGFPRRSCPWSWPTPRCWSRRWSTSWRTPSPTAPTRRPSRSRPTRTAAMW